MTSFRLHAARNAYVRFNLPGQLLGYFTTMQTIRCDDLELQQEMQRERIQQCDGASMANKSVIQTIHSLVFGCVNGGWHTQIESTLATNY